MYNRGMLNKSKELNNMSNIVDKMLQQESRSQELRKQNVLVLHDFKFDTNKQMIAETLKTIYKNKNRER